jgi:hypothetical protein
MLISSQLKSCRNAHEKTYKKVPNADKTAKKQKLEFINVS